MTALQSFRRFRYNSVFSEQSFEDFKRQAETISTIEKKDKLSWTRNFEPDVNKNLKTLYKFFAKHILDSKTDDETASSIAISWVTCLGSKVFENRITLSSEEIDLFQRVKIAFDTLSVTYNEAFTNKYGKLITSNMDNLDFYTPKQNYTIAARDLNHLINSQIGEDQFLSESDEVAPRTTSDLKAMFPKGEEIYIGAAESRQRRMHQQNRRIGLAPDQKQLSDATLDFMEQEGLLSGDFTGVYK
ncbi:MAG: hypothetical protein KR126chlam6_00718 [Candidatus Anoxychlamydiales bacterium]|nr:hypothetical protein [Candidatus Anoxychlamydiales bacterium]